VLNNLKVEILEILTIISWTSQTFNKSSSKASYEFIKHLKKWSIHHSIKQILLDTINQVILHQWKKRRLRTNHHSFWIFDIYQDRNNKVTCRHILSLQMVRVRKHQKGLKIYSWKDSTNTKWREMKKEKLKKPQKTLNHLLKKLCLWRNHLVISIRRLRLIQR